MAAATTAVAAEHLGPRVRPRLVVTMVAERSRSGG